MPRKKTASGRKKKPTLERRINLQLKKINKNIKRLENAGNFNTFASKELVHFVQQSKNLSLKTSKNKRKTKGGKKVKRHTVVFNPSTKPTTGSLRLIAKKFDKIIKNKVFYNIGIRKMRKEIRKKVTKTLSETYGRQMEKEDVDLFYDVAKYKTDDLIQQIGASEFFVLIQSAKDASQSEEDWVTMLGMYVDINNDYMREKAEYLYKKYVS